MRSPAKPRFLVGAPGFEPTGSSWALEPRPEESQCLLVTSRRCSSALRSSGHRSRQVSRPGSGPAVSRRLAVPNFGALTLIGDRGVFGVSREHGARRQRDAQSYRDLERARRRSSVAIGPKHWLAQSLIICSSVESRAGSWTGSCLSLRCWAELGRWISGRQPVSCERCRYLPHTPVPPRSRHCWLWLPSSLVPPPSNPTAAGTAMTHP